MGLIAPTVCTYITDVFEYYKSIVGVVFIEMRRFQ